MTGIETALLVAGTAISAVGAIQQGQAAKSAANYNADLQRRNASITMQQASENARRQERLNRKRLSTKRNNMASMDVLEDDAKEAELERLSIIYQGEIGAQTSNLDASLFEARGKSAEQSGYMTAAGTLLEGGAKYGTNAGWFDDNAET
jgi:hypothetical protein